MQENPFGRDIGEEESDFEPANGWQKREGERREWSEDGKVRVKRRGWDTGARKLRWESDLTENQ